MTDMDLNQSDKEQEPMGEAPPAGEEVTPLPAAEGPSLEKESSKTNPEEVDPLMELRQSLVSGETEPEAKPDFLRRVVTGTLGSRKSPGRTKESGYSGTGFGVRTTGTVPESPAEPSGLQVVRNPDKGVAEPAVPEPAEVEPAPKPVSRVVPFDPSAEPPRKTGSLYEDLDEEADEAEPSSSFVFPFLGREHARKMSWDSPIDSASKVRPPLEEQYEEPEAETPPATQPEPAPQLPSGEYTRQQLNRYIAYNPKQTLWTRFKAASPIDKGLIIALILAFFAVGALLFSLFNQSRLATALPSPTPASTTEALGIPVPMGLQLPGGWHFVVKAGTTVDGKWTPTTSEWLEGTEIRRVIAIPWNKQIEAVVRTFVVGDQIDLEMSNSDQLSYTVQSVTQVPVTDTSVMYDTHPSLAIILMNPGADTRWVIVAVP